MNISKLELNEIGTLERANDVGLWAILKKLMDADIARITREMDEHPCTSDADWKKDQKWKLAQCAKLRELLKLPEDARKALETHKDAPQ